MTLFVPSPLPQSTVKFMKLQPQNCWFPWWNSSPKKPQNIVAILNSIQRPGLVFVTSFCPKDFVQIASDQTFNYHSGLWLLLSHIILSQACSTLKIVKWLIAWKNRLRWPCRLQFFRYPRISSPTEWRHINTAWLPWKFQNGGLRSRFFRANLFWIADRSEAYSGEWKS